jgi:hypothetical protein
LPCRLHRHSRHRPQRQSPLQKAPPGNLIFVADNCLPKIPTPSLSTHLQTIHNSSLSPCIPALPYPTLRMDFQTKFRHYAESSL